MNNQQRRAAQLEASNQISYGTNRRGTTAFHQNGQVHTIEQNTSMQVDFHDMTPEQYTAFRAAELQKANADKFVPTQNVNQHIAAGKFGPNGTLIK
jgi:hypothetical protein